jgi:hypothetical protein
MAPQGRSQEPAMYGQEMKKAALILRRNGVLVQDVARALSVSAGWASKATAEVRIEDSSSRMLVAKERDLQADVDANAAGRQRRFSTLSARRKASIDERLTELRECMKGEQNTLPHWSSPEYKVVDRVQQVFAKDEQHPLFSLMSSEWPEMLSHLVEWKRVRQPQDKSEAAFRATAQRVHDRVLATGKPLSTSDVDWQVQQDARWLWRWKCNANGRIKRKRNVERAQVFSEIAIIVELLSSPVPSIYAEGKALLDGGRWTALFNSLRAADTHELAGMTQQ